MGYTIVDSGTGTRCVDAGGKTEDDFEGCECNRKLIFDDTYKVARHDHHYNYAYRPSVVILTTAAPCRAVIEREVEDVAPPL